MGAYTPTSSGSSQYIAYLILNYLTTPKKTDMKITLKELIYNYIKQNEDNNLTSTDIVKGVTLSPEHTNDAYKCLEELIKENKIKYSSELFYKTSNRHEIISEEYDYGTYHFQRMVKDGRWYVTHDNMIVSWGQYRHDLEELIDLKKI